MNANTIYSIAKEAGVSTATVSRVINNKPSVSEKTRRKVLSVIEQLDYQPNTFAQGLASSKLPLVGIIMINTTTPHYGKIIDELSEKLSQLQYLPILCKTDGSTDNKYQEIRALIGLGCRAVFCIGSVFKDTLIKTTLLSDFSDVHFLISNCMVTAPNAYSFLVDDEHGISQGIQLLLEHGHHNIAYIKDADSYSGFRKRDSFISCMQSSGLDPNPDMIIETKRGIECGRKAANDLLRTGKDFSAVICGDDLTAVGLIQELQKRGRRIPEDCAVIGYNNALASLCTTPAITSIDTKVQSMADYMVSTFQQLECNENPPHLIKIIPELLVREST